MAAVCPRVAAEVTVVPEVVEDHCGSHEPQVGVVDAPFEAKVAGFLRVASKQNLTFDDCLPQN